ncbi:MAG: adenylate/guanylate cyclase domain-containing protein [Rhodospirillaceae bacterium]
MPIIRPRAWGFFAAKPAAVGTGLGVLTGALIVVTVTLTVFTAFQVVPFLSASVQWISDFETATLRPHEPQHPDVIVVAITEDTLEHFTYRSPIDRGFLARTLRLLDQSGVRAILIDLLFDQPTEPEKDAELKQTINALHTPLVVSYGLSEGGLNEKQIAFENGFLKPELRGLANIVKDTAAGTVRRIYPGRRLADGRFMNGVVGALVEKVGGTAPAGETDLAFRAPPDDRSGAFKVLPAHALAMLPRSWLAGKVVLIGTVLSLTDRHRTPYAVVRDDDLGNMPGVIIHAHAVAQLLDGRRAPSIPAEVGLGLILGFAVLGVLLGRAIPAPGRRVVVGLPLIVGCWPGAMALAAAGGPLLPLVQPITAFLVAGWITDLAATRHEREQRRFLQTAFARYVSPAVLEEITGDPTKMTLRAVRKEVSVIFTDVAGFTTLAETLDAEQLSNLLNRYRGMLSRILFSYGGTLNQFTGDGLYAMFNAPGDQPDHAVRALSCAMALDRAAMTFHQAELARGIAFGVTRIGVHTAPAAVGNFGSDERFEYTALGDTVNTASRAEGMNKHFQTRICITGPNARYNPEVPCRPIGKFILKGKTGPLDILEPLHPEAAQSAHITEYRQAYALLEAGDPEAADHFRTLAARYPADGVIAFHVTRLNTGANGTLVMMTSK